MKRTIKSFLLVVAVATTLVSCIKERDMNIDGSKSVGMVAFATTGDDMAAASSVYSGFYSDLGSLASGASTSFNINIQYAGPSEAPSDITVKLEIDADALTKYNTENGTTLVVPPASVFTLPATAVIKKGTRMVQVAAKITNSADFDFAKSYALPVKISDAAGTAISSNLGKAVYTFGLRNIYDGHYSLKGYTLRAGDPAKTGNFVRPAGMDLVTVGSNAVQFAELQVWTDLTGVGIGNPVFTIGANNLVTVSSSGGAYNAPGYNCRYEPATKTFYVSFAWGAGPSARLATDTLTYIGPRH